jgi:hypothetical protein
MISRATYDFVRAIFGPPTAELLGDFAGGIEGRPPPRIRGSRPPRGSRSTRDRPQDMQDILDRKRGRDERKYQRAIATAHQTIEKFSGQPVVAQLVDGLHPRLVVLRTAVRTARSRTHPDRNPGRTSRDFLRVQRAAELLSRRYGVTL